ncbi:MAG: aminopeptidase N [Gammaproteobacteria bacterium]|jgi:aminopeptidase N
MKTDQSLRKYLSEYTPPEFTISKTKLEFQLSEGNTRVKSLLSISRQTGAHAETGTNTLKLDGINLKLLSVSINDVALTADQYQLSDEQLTIPDVADSFEFACEVEINPAANTRLEGLYLSSGNFCTQCEAQGFRYITYYLDRPDVMSTFNTLITGDQQRFPHLLSNGNLIDSGVSGDQHWAEWSDPYPKPSYLFALVAGDLARIDGEFVTTSGRTVALQFFTEHHNKDKCDHALTSLQKAMKWDEETFGLEYDLDLYMVVAVDDFNMGAMENKGLNVFNTKYVLANPQTATDDDYLGIEGVIGHEYFHNWTGNRVTCRDWFQLSLKEGLTVFRDQEFSSDMSSRAIQRISDVRVLRNHQFPEDAGPMAHPIRPAFYQEINNFYTATVYNKGAEVVRMIHTLLGKAKFRKGMDLYFERFDGQAVTTDDFRQTMQDASGIDLSQFQRWYEQSATPKINIKRAFDPKQKTLELLVTQDAGYTRGEPNRPFHLPMRLSLFDQAGQAVVLDDAGNTELTLDIKQLEQQFHFDNIDALPVVSAFREFSAPVSLNTDLDNNELALLMSCDNDAFNRWEASQQLTSRVILTMLDAANDEWPGLMRDLVAGFEALLNDNNLDLALKAEMLVLPGEKYLGELLDIVDVHRVRQAREAIRKAVAATHENLLVNCYQQCIDLGEYSISALSIGQRRLKNTCLAYLLTLEKDIYFDLCRQQFESADNMTDQMACLSPIVNYQHAVRDHIVEHFYQQWQDTALVVDKWFSAQGLSYQQGSLDTIIELFEHPAYSLSNPNRARSLLGALIGNSSAFHQADGAGYQFVADKIVELDQTNPQVAARMANAFLHWRKLLPAQAALMKKQIERIAAIAGISNDLDELVTTSLAN